MAELPELSSEKDLNETSRSQRYSVAISELRLALENMFGKNNIIKINPAYTSKTCHSCKSIQQLDASVIKHTCTNCKETWDRDYNAAENIFERGSNQQKIGGARKVENDNDIKKIGETTWQKRKRRKQEQAEQLGGARKATANDIITLTN